MSDNASTTVIYTEQHNRRETWVWGGWNLTDDDTPHPPEPDPLASAQSRRAWRLQAEHNSEAAR